MNIALSLLRGVYLRNIFSIFFVFLALLITGVFFMRNTNYLVYAQENVTANHVNIVETNKTPIRIFPPKTLDIIHNDEQMKYITYAENVAEILEEYEIEYAETDIIIPEIGTNLDVVNVIQIYSIEEKISEVFNEIPFLTETIYDNSLSYGTRKIVVYGVVGREKETYKKTYMNKELISEELVGKEIISNPRNQVVKVGTKKTALEGRNCSHWNNVVDNVTSSGRERDILKFLISCESNCNAGANNSNTYLGLLQFHRNTFNHYGNGGDIWDGKAQINAALVMIRGGGLNHHWPACANRFHNQNR